MQSNTRKDSNNLSLQSPASLYRTGLYGAESPDLSSRISQHDDAELASRDEKIQTKPSPSRVLFLSQLNESTDEKTVTDLLQPFGEVEKIILLRRRGQALVQMKEVQEAENAISSLSLNPPLLSDDQPLHIEYSKNQELRTLPSPGNNGASLTRRYSNSSTPPNHILLTTIQNPKWPITTDLLYKVFSGFGEVKRIVIFAKSVGLQALIEFSTISEAMTAKTSLDGKSIYPGCCTLVISFSNLSTLIIKENGLRSKDFTNPDLPSPVIDAPVNPQDDTRLRRTNSLQEGSGASSIVSTSQSGDGSSGRAELRRSASLDVDAASPQTPVLLICNLHEDTKCDSLFNLFSCYGNVNRVKKLHSKPGYALMQMESPAAAMSALSHLRGYRLFRRSLDIRLSKHQFIASRSNTGDEGDKDYGNSQNRFTGKFANNTKHIYSPTNVLHVSNLPAEETTAKSLREHLSQFARVGEIRIFNTQGSQSNHCQALIKFPNVEIATNMLAMAHNSEFCGKRLRIAFSQSAFGS